MQNSSVFVLVLRNGRSDFQEAGEWAQTSQEADESPRNDQGDALGKSQKAKGNQIVENPQGSSQIEREWVDQKSKEDYGYESSDDSHGYSFQ